MIPGHLVFYSTSAVLLDQLVAHPSLRDFKSFRDQPWFTDIADEADWSFYILSNDQITFAAFPGLADARFHFSLGPPDAGTYELRNWWAFNKEQEDNLIPLLPEERAYVAQILVEHGASIAAKHEEKGQSIFTSEGSEYEIEARKGSFPGFIWFQPQFAFWVIRNDTLWKDLGFGNRFILRRERGGPVLDRQEPARHIVMSPPRAKEPWEGGTKPYLMEGLYNHFQGEKYKSKSSFAARGLNDADRLQEWWELPEKPYGIGQTMYIDRQRGIELWDRDGNLVWRGSKTLAIPDIVY
jgi:hypothetical protein